MALRMDLEEALTWCQTLRFEIELMGKRFPELKEKLRAAETAWNTSFKTAEETMEKRLRSVKANLWPEMAKAVTEGLQQRKTAEVNAMSLETAEQWVRTLEAQAQGGTLPPECRMLLAYDARYAQEPELEFAEGRTEIFSSEGLPGALGVALTIRMPQSWKRYPITPGKALQLWGSNGGHGTELMAFSISMRPLPAVPTAGNLEELLSEETAHERSSATCKVVGFSREKTGSLSRAVTTTVDTDESVPDTKTVVVMHQLFQKDVLIVLAFMLPDAAKGTKDPRFKRLEPVMKKIIDSLDIRENRE